MSAPSPQDEGGSSTAAHGSRQRVVVGIDGSPQAALALAWAIGVVRYRGVDLEVVSTWYLPEYDWGEMPPVSPDPAIELAEQARSLVDQAAAEARAAAPGTEVYTTALEGSAASVLVELSKDAGLLVVGSRGRGGFKGLLLGSVSQQCASHAHCPVVVVRELSSAAGQS